MTKIFYHLLIILKQIDKSNEISLANSGILEFFVKNLIVNLTCAVYLTRAVVASVDFSKKNKRIVKTTCVKMSIFSNVSKTKEIKIKPLFSG